MQKLRFFIIAIFFPFTLMGQQRTKIILQSFDRIKTIPGEDVSYLRNPVFKHDNAVLSCDSGIFYSKKNYFEAYDNVHINQADTVNIFSDRLSYDGNNKMAHLTSNVRLLDRESVLTTNVLDYNMASKIGTYVNGGKIVNKDVTLTSKNGYYFSNSRDAYFRYNVVVVTPNSTIKSDTLRYNTFSNWTYFYGPTNIKGKDDNLYTENGAYNTKSEYAYFGKKNLYTQGSKSLKGDSLYYDGKAGYGKAVRNIIFKDTIDNVIMHGQLGQYYKKDQRTVVTKKAYVGYATNDTIEVNMVKQPDSLWLGADTLETQMVLQNTLKLIPTPEIKKDSELEDLDEEPAEPAEAGEAAGKEEKIKPTLTVPAPPPPSDSKKSDRKSRRKDRKKKELSEVAPPPPVTLPDSNKTAIDSAKVIADSTGVRTDTTGTIITKDSVISSKKDSSGLKVQTDKAKITKATDSNAITKEIKPFNPADTVQTRIIQAYHNVKVYKSNMQAKADSLFYTSADSTFRWFRNPMLWSQGSQQTGDTIYLQLKNKNLNAIRVLQNAFIVNIEKDSSRFNQVKGKLITGFFKDGKLSTVYVDGNSESIYYLLTEKDEVDKMNQTVSSRIKIIFKENDISEVIPIKNVEGVMYPAEEIRKEPILTGFIWKPELRPLSKEEVIGTIKKPTPKPKIVVKKTTVEPHPEKD